MYESIRSPLLNHLHGMSASLCVSPVHLSISLQFCQPHVFLQLSRLGQCSTTRPCSETALDAKLAGYTKIASTISRGSSSVTGTSRDQVELEEDGVGGYKLVEEEVEELLGKVSRGSTPTTQNSSR